MFFFLVPQWPLKKHKLHQKNLILTLDNHFSCPNQPPPPPKCSATSQNGWKQFLETQLSTIGAASFFPTIVHQSIHPHCSHHQFLCLTTLASKHCFHHRKSLSKTHCQFHDDAGLPLPLTWLSLLLHLCVEQILCMPSQNQEIFC